MEVEYDDGICLEYLFQRYEWEERPLDVGQRIHLQMKPLLLKGVEPTELEP